MTLRRNRYNKMIVAIPPGKDREEKERQSIAALPWEEGD